MTWLIVIAILVLVLAILGAIGLTWLIDKIRNLNPFSDGD